jgi:hypothetical protein
MESSHGRRGNLGDGRIPQHQVPGIPAISKPWVSPAYLVFLKSNLRTRLCLKGVGCDASCFYLTLIVGQPCWHWSNHGQPGSSPRKTHQPTLITPLIKWTHMCGQTMVKPWSNPTQTLVTLGVFRNFCRVLQNSSKHLKIYLYGSCPACWGTQPSCRLAFQILRGKRWKTCSKVSTSYSRQLSGIQSWQALPAKSIEKNTI